MAADIFWLEQNKNEMQIWVQVMHAVKQQANKLSFWRRWKLAEIATQAVQYINPEKELGFSDKMDTYYLFSILYTGILCCI